MTEKTWKDILSCEKNKTYFQKIMNFLKSERNQNKNLYPPKKDTFNFLKITPYSKVKIVIIGQDPYHQTGQANGLAFSVNRGVKIPPSLSNIFKELNQDIDFKIPNHGCLEKWAHQGVLLLNTTLTVEEGKPMSHAGIGWEKFTDKIISSLNSHEKEIIFFLWGSHAKSKSFLIDKERHFVLQAAHPSPLSAHKGFFNCKHFSLANTILKEKGRKEIDWQI